MALSQPQRAGSDIPSKLPATLLKLGPAFIKLGQILSTRPDVLPKEYIEALEALQENVPPFPFEAVRAVVREELRKDISELYRSFEEVLVASASLAQVHFAALPDGTEVAVKVQRPDVRRKIEDDLAALDSLLRIPEMVSPGRVKRANIRGAFDEFRRYTMQELDFGLEGRTMERFASNFREWDEVVIPKVHWALTSKRVLTMQRVSGMRLKEAVGRFSSKQKERLVRRLMEMEMKMFISDGFFHADLHPGNILFREDGKIVLLDFGMFGELSEEEIDHFTLYWIAVVRRQVKRAFYHFTQMTRRLPNADEEAFFEKFRALAEKFYASPLSEMTITQVYLEMISAGYKHGFVFPSDLMLHAKATTTAEALAFTLAPDTKAEELTREAVRKEFAKRARDFRRLAYRIGQVVPELVLTGEVLPASARDPYDGNSDAGFALKGLLDLVAALTEKMKSTNPSAWLRALIDPFTRDVLAEYHDKEEVEAILDDGWRRYEEIEPDIPVLSELGPTINLRLAGATLAIYEAFVSAGHSNEEALSIFRLISWSIYDRMGDLPILLASALTTHPHWRMKAATQVFRTFPFSSPDYEMVDVPAGKDVVGFDVLKCPVAEFFKSRGKGDLCYAT